MTLGAVSAKRFDQIDFLRAVAILCVIVIHTLSFNLGVPLTNFVWNYLHFVVAAFIFCSGYVFIAFYQNTFGSIAKTLRWYKKRFVRLVVPFYLYLFAHYALWLLFPTVFAGLGLQKSFSFVAQSVFLTGGVNLNWLPLLFLQLTIISPFLLRAMRNQKVLFFLIFFFFILTVFFTVRPFPYSYYRYVMWVPWSLVLLLSFVFFKKESIKRYLFVGSVCFLVFLSLFLLWHQMLRSVTLIDHKYPPDLFELSYEVAITCFILAISRLSLFGHKLIKKIYVFISRQSYQLFFIHYIILDAVLLAKHKGIFWQNAFMEIFFVLFFSLFLCWLHSWVFMVYLKAREKWQKREGNKQKEV